MRFGLRCIATLAISVIPALVAGSWTSARAGWPHVIPREVPAIDMRTGGVMLAPPIPYGCYVKDPVGCVHGLIAQACGLCRGKLCALCQGRGCGHCFGKGRLCGLCGGAGCDACGGGAGGGQGGGHGLFHHGGSATCGDPACGDPACGGSGHGHVRRVGLFHRGQGGGLGHNGQGHGGHGGHGSAVVGEVPYSTLPSSQQPSAQGPVVVPSGQSCGQCGGKGCGLCGGHGLIRTGAQACDGCGGSGFLHGKGCGRCGGSGLFGHGGGSGLFGHGGDPACGQCGGKGCGLCGGKGLGKGCGLCGGKGCAACAKARALLGSVFHRGGVRYFVGPGGPVPLTPGYVPYVVPVRSPRDYFAFPPFTDIDP